MNEQSMPIKELQKKTYEGNLEAYGDLSVAYLDHYEDLLYWAMLMANKYNYAQAYYDVFLILTYKEEIDSKSMDENTKLLALGYLKVAVDKKVKGAITTLHELKLADSVIMDNPKIRFIK